MPHFNYVPDKDFKKDKMITMKGGNLAAIFPDGELHPESIKQTAKATCWILGTLIPLSKSNPAMIKNLFHDNGDGTVTIFFNKMNFAKGCVTIDKTLPDMDVDCPDWVRLLEKGLAAAGLSFDKTNDDSLKMKNINWGHVDLLLRYIDPNVTPNQTDANSLFSESDSVEEATKELKKFCKTVVDKNGSIMISTSKHNMSVTNIDDKFIYYYDQRTQKNHKLSFDSLFTKKSNIDCLVFSVQSAGKESLMTFVEPKKVMEQIPTWHDSKKSDDMIKNTVRGFIFSLEVNFNLHHKTNINMFGEGHDTTAFLNDSKEYQKLIAEFTKDDYATFHKKYRTDYTVREKIANAYFDFIKRTFVDNLHEPQKKGLSDGLLAWRNAVKPGSWNLRVHSDFPPGWPDQYANLKVNKEGQVDKKAKYVNIGKSIVVSNANMSRLENYWLVTKGASSMFKNSEQWKNYRHSLHMTVRLARIARDLLKNEQKKLGGDFDKEKFKSATSKARIEIGDLKKPVRCYIENYCVKNNISYLEGISYRDVCEMIGFSFKKTMQYAKEYQNYKTNNGLMDEKQREENLNSDDKEKLQIVDSLVGNKSKKSKKGTEEKKNDNGPGQGLQLHI